jgi:hypothetical protein
MQANRKKHSRLVEDDSNIFDDENAVDLFAKVIAEKLALMAYWDIFQR